MKIALIIGITGQDGSYLAEFLLEKGYIVHGIKRVSSVSNIERIEHLYKNKHDKNNNLFIHGGDLTDSCNIIRIIKEVNPDEIYNLGAQSHVQISFESPEYTANCDALGCLRVLEAIKILGLKCKFYQASTSELFGKVQEIPQNEKTPMYPRSPYATAKLFAYWTVINYREAYNIFACNGILFNHESPRRSELFVTRKITKSVVKICQGKKEMLYLGNIDAQRDWGYAKDYIEGMWLMLQQEKPDDFILATGITTSVREFLRLSFLEMGVIISFKGLGENEVAFVVECMKEKYILPKGKIVMSIDKKYYRPNEVDLLIGDATKAKNILKWEPKYTIKNIIKEMISFELT